LNSLKTLSLLFAFFLIGSSNTFSQSRRANLTAEQKEEIRKNVEAYAAELQLSEVQKPKFD